MGLSHGGTRPYNPHFFVQNSAGLQQINEGHQQSLEENNKFNSAAKKGFCSLEKSLDRESRAIEALKITVKNVAEARRLEGQINFSDVLQALGILLLGACAWCLVISKVCVLVM